MNIPFTHKVDQFLTVENKKYYKCLLNGMIFALREYNGLGFKKISSLLGIPKSTLNYHYISNKTKSKRRRKKINWMMMAFIKEQIHDDPSISLESLKVMVEKEFHIYCSRTTIKNELKEHSDRSVKTKVKPLLSAKTKRLRYNYCNVYLTTFDNVVFVDESTFQLEGNRIYVWTKRPGRRFENHLINTYHQNKSIKTNVFAAIIPNYGKCF